MIQWDIQGEEITPQNRRDYIHGILSETTYGDNEPKEGIIDLLADTMHYCRLQGIRFYEVLLVARNHFDAEKGGACQTD
jgi:hypothetical protein